MRRIYMDNSATTRVTEPVFEAIRPYFCEVYGNASSVHSFGREARRAVEAARAQVAAAIGAQSREIYFTGSGTEANNWAIFGAARALSNKGKHIITSAIEHHAVLHVCEQLEKEGYEVTYVPVDELGLVSPKAVEEAIREDTILITMMLANNEIGTILPIAEIGRIAKAHGILMHTDAVQAIGSMDVNVDGLNVDMLSLSGHKIHAPKGVGALYIRTKTRIQPLILGGAQERAQRAGTENVTGIVALGKAIELITQDIPARVQKLSALRDHMIKRILTEIPKTQLNGDAQKRLPGNVNVSIRYIEGEALLLSLDLMGVAGSSGSACTSGSLDPSHVLLAIGLPHEIAHGSLRLSLSDENTMEEADAAVDALIQVTTRLREMSPLTPEGDWAQEA